MNEMSFDQFAGRPITALDPKGRIDPAVQQERDARGLELVQAEHAVEDDPGTKRALEREIARRGGKPAEDGGMSFDEFVGKPAPVKVGQPEEQPSLTRKALLSADRVISGPLAKIADIGHNVAETMERSGAAVNRFYDAFRAPESNRLSGGVILTPEVKALMDKGVPIDMAGISPETRRLSGTPEQRNTQPSLLRRGLEAAGTLIGAPFDIASKELQTFLTEPVQRIVEKVTGNDYGEAYKKEADALTMVPTGGAAKALRAADEAYLSRQAASGIENRGTYPKPEEPRPVEHSYPAEAIQAAGPELTAKQQIETSLGIKSKVEQDAFNKTRKAEVRAAFKDDGDYADYLEHLAKEREANDVAFGYNKVRPGEATKPVVETAIPEEVKSMLPPGAPEGMARLSQQGGIDPDLLRFLGMPTAGGLIGAGVSDDPLSGAVRGAAMGLLGASGFGRTGQALLGEALQGLDRSVGSLSTRIGNISEPIKLASRDYERRILEQTHQAVGEVDPFLRRLEDLSGPGRDVVKRALLSGNMDSVVKDLPELASDWNRAKTVLNSYKGQLQELGRFKGGVDEYFPRVVTDKEGLFNALGKEQRGPLANKLLAAETDMVKKAGRGLTDLEESRIINSHLAYTPEGSPTRGFTKQRGVGDITQELTPFYADPATAIHRYLSSATQEIEKARFFGKDAQNVSTRAGNHLNLDASIGNLVQREMSAGRMSPGQAEDLKSMLKARFEGGEKSAAGGVQLVKNLANTGLLGSIVSAASQLGDLGTTVYAHGLRPTITSVVQKLTGNKRVSAKDFGLADHISEEFTSQASSARFLNKVFKYSGFSAIDMFGKEVTLNAALNKFERMARTDKGAAKLEEKYGAAFGDEFPALVSDLRAGGAPSDRVKSVLFSELSDLQPISRMEMPQKYLENPNGRVLYMLKSFMLKQADVVRRDALQEIAKGTRAGIMKGTSNLTKYAITLGISGATTDMVKDYLTGKPFDPKWSDIADNIWKTFGWSSYAINKLGKGKVLEALGSTLMPPYQMFDEIIRGDPKAVQYIPLVGKLIYNWEMGGNVTKEQKAAQRARMRDMGMEVPGDAAAARQRQLKQTLKDMR